MTYLQSYRIIVLLTSRTGRGGHDRTGTTRTLPLLSYDVPADSRPKYNEDAWNELLGIYTPEPDPNLVDAVSQLLSRGTDQLGSGIIIDSDVDVVPPSGTGSKSCDDTERPPENDIASLVDRIKSNPRVRTPKIYNLSIAVIILSRIINLQFC